MNVLDALLFGIRNVLFAGSAMPTRSAVNVHGAGVTVTDDVANERTDIEIPGAGPGAGLTLTAVKTAYYEAAVGELVQVDATAGDITIVAPLNASGHTDERWGVIRVEPTLPVSHTVTINADDGVNGEGSYLMPIARQVVVMRSDGSTWRVEGTYQATEFAPVAAALAAADADIDVNAQKITNLADPTTDQDAATKAYVDANVGGGGGLQTGADIDYATIGAGTPQDLKALGDGSYTIGGRAHAVVNTANASSLVLGATGLRGKATNVGSSFPQVHLPLSTLAPAVSLAKHEVWIIARIQRIVADPATDYSSIRMALDYESWAGGDAAARWVAAQMDMLSGSRRVIGQSYGFADANNSAVVSGSDDEVFALRFQRGAMDVQYYGAAWGGSWPDLDALQLRYSQSHGMSGSPPADIWTPSAATLRMVWSNSGGTTNEWAIPRIQVLYR